MTPVIKCDSWMMALCNMRSFSKDAKMLACLFQILPEQLRSTASSEIDNLCIFNVLLLLFMTSSGIHWHYPWQSLQFLLWVGRIILNKLSLSSQSYRC